MTAYEEGIPSISISGYTGTGSAGITENLNSVYEGSDNLTINHGKHNFKFGGQWRNGPVDNIGANNPRGVLTFTADLTGIPDAFAAFMLGFPLSANSSEGSPLSNLRQNKFGLYWLDEYKATPRLSINYGLRYDWYGAVTDAGGASASSPSPPARRAPLTGCSLPNCCRIRSYRRSCTTSTGSRSCHGSASLIA